MVPNLGVIIPRDLRKYFWRSHKNVVNRHYKVLNMLLFVLKKLDLFWISQKFSCTLSWWLGLVHKCLNTLIISLAYLAEIFEVKQVKSEGARKGHMCYSNLWQPEAVSFKVAKTCIETYSKEAYSNLLIFKKLSNVVDETEKCDK